MITTDEALELSRQALDASHNANQVARELSEIANEAIRQRNVLLDFARRHHEVCEDCEGNGKIYNNADPTSGQWVECPVSKLIYELKGVKL